MAKLHSRSSWTSHLTKVHDVSLLLGLTLNSSLNSRARFIFSVIPDFNIMQRVLILFNAGFNNSAKFPTRLMKGVAEAFAVNKDSV